MKRLRARTNRPLRGRVAVPGDKSISHRALIFGALAEGRSRVAGLNHGADVSSTRRVLASLGVAIQNSNDSVEVEGCGRAALVEPAAPLDCGNSGTTLRTLTGVLAGARGAFVLAGDASLVARPMLRIVAPLRSMGARIDGRAFGDRPPLFVRGSELQGIDYESPVASAQVKTALLLAGMAAQGTTTVTEPASSRDHTERMLGALGAPLVKGMGTVSIDGGSKFGPLNMTVPGDPSAAAFLLVAATLIEGSELTVTEVGVNPTRIGFVDVLREMGAQLEVSEDGWETGEPVGRISARASSLSAVEVGPGRIPGLIDEVPILAVAATQAEGITTFKGVRELRVKESDRITAMADGLKRLGARVEVGPDTLSIEGPVSLSGGEVDSYGDHRIAMALAIAGTLTPEKVTVKGWGCVDVSFPGFLSVLEGART